MQVVALLWSCLVSLTLAPFVLIKWLNQVFYIVTEDEIGKLLERTLIVQNKTRRDKLNQIDGETVTESEVLEHQPGGALLNKSNGGGGGGNKGVS